VTGVGGAAIPTLLDHVVIAGPDLAALVAWFAERTGVQAEPGGVHPTGTANALVALTVDGARGSRYLELIGPDPSRADSAVPTRFGIAALTAPRVVTYAIHPAGIEQVAAAARGRGHDPGPVSELSRRTTGGEVLRWHLTHPRPEHPDVPFLIDWGDTPNPGDTVVPTVELVGFTQTARAGSQTAAARRALGLPGSALALLATGPEDAYELTVGRADGRVAALR
jgi:hypothetical protein